jgi:26S proteasome regulatory subunit N9
MSDPTAAAVDFCESLSREQPSLSEPCALWASWLQNKLWHQLTLSLLEVCDATEDATILLNVYNHVVLPLAKKLDALSVARLASRVGAVVAETAADVATAKSLLEERLLAATNTTGSNNNNNSSNNNADSAAAAQLFLQSKLALLVLQHDFESLSPIERKTMQRSLQDNETCLQTTTQSYPALVHATHYETAMVFYKRVGPPDVYCQQVLQYLNYYAPTDTTTTNNKDTALAVDLVVAALIGKTVYHLTQVEQTLLVQETLAKQQESHHQFHWLYQLLHVIAHGKINDFATLTRQYAKQLEQEQPLLMQYSSVLQEKMVLLALVKHVFDQPSSERIFELETLAQVLQLPAVDQVEWVIMRAFSVHLLEGSMDQVDGTLKVTWVSPKSLTTEQLQQLGARFENWSSKVKELETTLKTTVEAAF